MPDNVPLEQIPPTSSWVPSIMKRTQADPTCRRAGQQAGHSPSADPAECAPRGSSSTWRMRLYYYPKGQNVVQVLPIGIGQLGSQTPRRTGSPPFSASVA